MRAGPVPRRRRRGCVNVRCLPGRIPSKSTRASRVPAVRPRQKPKFDVAARVRTVQSEPFRKRHGDDTLHPVSSRKGSDQPRRRPVRRLWRRPVWRQLLFVPTGSVPRRPRHRRVTMRRLPLRVLPRCKGAGCLLPVRARKISEQAQQHRL